MRETSPLDQCIVQQLANGRYHRQDTLPLYFAESDPTHPRCTLVLLRSPYAGAKYGYLHQLWSRFLKLAGFNTQNRHPIAATPAKSVCKEVIAISLRR